MNPDFKDLFAELNAAGVSYLLVGGYALAFHAVPRFTKDLDVWVDPVPDNASRVLTALKNFGAPLGDLSLDDLTTPGIVYQIGIAPNRIDVLTSIDGVDFTKAWTNRIAAEYAEEPIHVIGREELLRNKLASGRPQDLVDAETLKKLT